MLSILIVAVALGLSNFAASIAIGLQGVDGALRRDIIVIFGFFEAAMPVVGLVLGRRMVDAVGSSASYAGAVLLVLTGIYTLVQARRESSSAAPRAHRRGRLLVTGAALSIDNLIVGFALGTYKVPVLLGALTIALVSVAMSLAGIELGHRLGVSVEKWSGELAGAVLTAVGILIAAGVL